MVFGSSLPNRSRKKKHLVISVPYALCVSASAPRPFFALGNYQDKLKTRVLPSVMSDTHAISVKLESFYNDFFNSKAGCITTGAAFLRIRGACGEVSIFSSVEQQYRMNTKTYD